jgi:hypothetical protein
MSTDVSVANSDTALIRMDITTLVSRLGPGAADIVQLLQTAFPRDWERHLRNYLGDATPYDLPPTELARLTEHVFWLVKQMGIKDPAAWLATYRARMEATKAPAPPVGDIAAHRRSAQLEPLELTSSLAETSGTPSPNNAAAPVVIGMTKTEVLCRAKAVFEAGGSLRDVSEWLAFAQDNLHATQREIAEAIGKSASWVNRLLKWRRSGCKECSPFGPTTRAGRVAHAQ